MASITSRWLPTVHARPRADSLMRVSLRTRRGQAAFALSCVFLAGIYGYRLAQSFRAWRAANSMTVDGSRLAIRLEPDNAQHRRQLGLLLTYSGPESWQEAAAILGGAARLNPHSARAWLDLAKAYRLLGDEGGERDALRRAADAEPMNSEVAWELGNMLLSSGDWTGALRKFRIVVEDDPNAAERVYDLCWRAKHDVTGLLEIAIPPDPEYYATLLRIVVSSKDAFAARRVFEGMLGLHTPLHPQLVFPYLQFLLTSQLGDSAGQAWNELISTDTALNAYARGRNLIVNGGFEANILNGGLDWRYARTDGVTAAIDTADVRTGNRSLALSFDGAMDSTGVYQILLLEPGREYRFRASHKTSELFTASTPRFVLTDTSDHTELMLSPELPGGSTGWQETEMTFRAGPNTRVAVLTLIRRPGKSLIRGQVWIDDVELEAR